MHRAGRWRADDGEDTDLFDFGVFVSQDRLRLFALFGDEIQLLLDVTEDLNGGADFLTQFQQFLLVMRGRRSYH